MKKKVQYLVDTFTDYNGLRRHFVLCAITTIEKNLKVTTFGISVQHPKDIFNEKIGKKIALGKAEKQCFDTITGDNQFSMNYDICEAYLKSYAKYFKEDPSIFLHWYKDPKKVKEEKLREKEEKEFYKEALKRGYVKNTLYTHSSFKIYYDPSVSPTKSDIGHNVVYKESK